jgi:hypothetical protein
MITVDTETGDLEFRRSERCPVRVQAVWKRNFGLREPLCQRPLSSNELHAAFGARVIGREDASTSVGALGLGGP